MALALLAAPGCRYDLTSVPRPEGGANGIDNVPGSCGDAAVEGGKRNGDDCHCAGECASGNCVDGQCCDTACQGTCQACNVPGFPGTCTDVPTGLPPRTGQCPAESAGSCGRDGTCDGAGACRKHPRGTTCEPPVCGANAVTSGRICDGEGACVAGATVVCTPYQCDPSGAPHCFGSCTGPGQCADGRPCLGGSCGKKFTGAACARADECGTGFCVDGVCCDSACAGSCSSCNQLGSMGICTLTAFGMADPKGKCADQGAASCGQTGACDGKGACARYSAGTECTPPACESSRLRFAGTCNGQGSCQGGAVIDCAPFGCSAAGCRGTCRSDADCSAGVHCVMGSCGLKELGAGCTSSAMCRSGFCVDGVCCNEACTGACRSCAMPTAPGMCTKTGVGLPDPRNVCLDQKAATCGKDGTCDGQGGCRLYAAGTECASATCATAVRKAVSTCDGKGGCMPGATTICAPFQCNGTECFTACTDGADCVAPALCTAGSCGLKPNGGACLAPSDCASGICEAGTCCDRACGGACESCRMAAAPGTCVPLKAGSVCGDGAVCTATGECRPCASGTSCPGTSCHTAQISCASGEAVCTDGGMLSPGTACGSNKVCSSTGTCVDCTAGLSCTGPVCQTAQTTCSSGGTVCAVTGFSPAGTACGSGLACDARGACVGCGGAGQPCCAGACNSGASCQQGICACTPACAGKSCGPDGCGGTCPPGCQAGSSCNASGSCSSCGAVGQACCAGSGCDPGATCSNGVCACAPSCAGKTCGPDGCGGTCPPGCAAGKVCSGNTCVACGAPGQSCCTGGMCNAGATCGSGGLCACVPSCAGKTCGDDGCGGTCAPGCGNTGTCSGGSCIACGGRGQPCCPGGTCTSNRDSCNSKSICACDQSKDCCQGCPANKTCCFPGCAVTCS